jgi:hypothetical protein
MVQTGHVQIPLLGVSIVRYWLGSRSLGLCPCDSLLDAHNAKAIRTGASSLRSESQTCSILLEVNDSGRSLEHGISLASQTCLVSRETGKVRTKIHLGGCPCVNQNLGYFDVRLRPVKIKSPVQEVLCVQRKPKVGAGARGCSLEKMGTLSKRTAMGNRTGGLQ